MNPFIEYEDDSDTIKTRNPLDNHKGPGKVTERSRDLC